MDNSFSFGYICTMKTDVLVKQIIKLLLLVAVIVLSYMCITIFL